MGLALASAAEADSVSGAGQYGRVGLGRRGRGSRHRGSCSGSAIEQAYRTVRRENVSRYLLARLARGTRMEIHPLNKSQVDHPTNG